MSKYYDHNSATNSNHGEHNLTTIDSRWKNDKLPISKLLEKAAGSLSKTTSS